MVRGALLGGLLAFTISHVHAQCTNYIIQVYAGLSPAQQTWQLVNSSNVVVASGGAPATPTVCLPNGCYTMRLFDSANNGWSYGMFMIRLQATNTVIATGTLLTGGFISHVVDIGGGCNPAPCTAYTLNVTSGSSPGQITWNLVDGINVIEAGGAPMTLPLCLDTGCFTMQLFDSFGDGWNGATWSLVDQFGNTVQSGTLSNGSIGSTTIALGVPLSNCSPVSPQNANDCAEAVDVCGNYAWLMQPSGGGSVAEAPPGSNSNPFMDYQDGLLSAWGTDNDGCLQAGEVNTIWMVIDIIGSGSLEFTFGGLGVQAGYYDWIMFPYNGTGCGPIQTGTLAPVRCNWNIVPWGGTGLSSTPPPPQAMGNYEPPLAVLAGESFLLGFSNHSGTTAVVPLTFGGTADIGCTPTPLPIELLSFTATAADDDVLLEWITATEQNTLRFDVQRSTGAEWIEIGELPAAGNSQQELKYELIDADPVVGMNYYRLVNTDIDGSQQVSPVRSVFFERSGLLVHPNPSEGSFWVNERSGKFDVYDALGQIVPFEIDASSEAGRQIYLRTPGVYTVRSATGRSERVVIR